MCIQRRVGRELEHNVAYAIRPPSADLGGVLGGLLHKSLLCYVASGWLAWHERHVRALGVPRPLAVVRVGSGG